MKINFEYYDYDYVFEKDNDYLSETLNTYLMYERINEAYDYDYDFLTLIYIYMATVLSYWSPFTHVITQAYDYDYIYT